MDGPESAAAFLALALTDMDWRLYLPALLIPLGIYWWRARGSSMAAAGAGSVQGAVAGVSVPAMHPDVTHSPEFLERLATVSSSPARHHPQRDTPVPARVEAPTPTSTPSVAPTQPEMLTFAGLRDLHERDALALIRPYPPRDLPKTRSHVGGLPDLPVGMPWPRASNDRGCLAAGAPLHFLGQVDLAEQPWRPDDLSATGTLMFFGALPDGYDWQTENDARVVYDPTSSGIATRPPEDLEAIQGGYGDYQQDFGGDDWLKCRTFPRWPLVGRMIKTMPQVQAFGANASHWPCFAGYVEAHEAFRAAEIARASGLRLDDILSRSPPSIGAVLADPGFPWTPRYIGLWARWVFQLRYQFACPDHLKPAVAALRDWADAAPAGAMAPAKALEFVVFASTHCLSPAAIDPRGRILQQVVCEAGADPALAACLPDIVYDFAAPFHRPVNLRSGPGTPRRDGKPVWTVRHHQMGGHVPSTQDPYPIDHIRSCLIQFQSDRGSNLILSDMGEADFMMRPQDLASADFDKAEAETRGG
jgi:hypothetical protein